METALIVVCSLVWVAGIIVTGRYMRTGKL